MISNIDADEKLEDTWLARAFQKDGHKIAIVDKNYDENLDSLYDVFLLRNTWDTEATVETIKEQSNFRKRIINKNFHVLILMVNMMVKIKNILLNYIKMVIQ